MNRRRLTWDLKKLAGPIAKPFPFLPIGAMLISGLGLGIIPYVSSIKKWLACRGDSKNK